MLDPAQLVAMRNARDALCDAARRVARADIEQSLRRCVVAMWRAEFSRQTMVSLVAAALDAGLPMGRGAARRARRAADIATWLQLAERVAAELETRAEGRGQRAEGY